MMKRFIAVWALAVGCVCSAFAQERTVILKILETTDVHGSFYPVNLITNEPKAGSLARVSTYVNSLRKDRGDHVLLFDNGDVLQGQPSVYYYNYIDTVSPHLCSAMLNYMRYDLGNLGNHDIETGRRVFERWAEQCQFPILGANVIDTRSGEPAYMPYKVFVRDGVKVAVLGMITPAIPEWLPESLWRGLRFDPMLATAEKWVKIIRERENPDLLIGLFHSGRNGGLPGENCSLEVAEKVPGFDVLMIGHDHLKSCRKVKNVDGDTVLVVNPANNAMRVAEVTLKVKIDANGNHVGKKVNAILKDVSTLPIDSAFMDHFAPQLAAVNKFVSQRVGRITKPISTKDAYFGSSSFIDLIHTLQLAISGAQISLTAPLSFNAHIDKGNIYVRDMFNLYKYENLLYTMRLSGQEIKDELEASYYYWTNLMQSPDDDLLWFSKRMLDGNIQLQNMSFNFDSAAGINYTVDVTKPKGEKVTITSMADGTPFRLDEYYTVAVNSYRGNGGGGLLTHLGSGLSKEELQKRIVSSTDKDLRYYLMEYIREHKVVKPKALKQWKFIPEEWTKPASERDYQKLFGEKYEDFH
jgi:2',3'-cyclic-nucleotide 2'-phosphodiesterase/3'-nucleotidase